MKILLMVIPLIWTCGNARNLTSLERLHIDLLQDYHPVRPVTSWNDTVQVELTFSLYHIRSLDGKSQVLSTSGQIQMSWHDPRLSWEPSDYDGALYIITSASSIWTPNVGLRNSVSDVINPNFREVFPVFVFANGWILWKPAGDFSSSCQLDMFRFPYDTQTCYLEFGNVIETEKIVNITTNSGGFSLEVYSESQEFILTSAHPEWTTWNLLANSTTRSMPGIRFTFTLKRIPLYYLLNIIIPTVVLALLSALNFAAPMGSGEKLSLGISTLLAFSVFMLILQDNTPQTDSPLLAIYLTAIMCTCCASIIIQMAVLNIYHVQPLRQLPRWIRMVEAWCSCVVSEVPEDDHTTTTKTKTKTKTSPGDEKHDSAITVDHKRQYPQNKLYEKREMSSGRSVLEQAIRREIQVITDKMASKEKEDALRRKWKKAARLFDRLFFIIFAIVHFVLIIAIFFGFARN